MATAILEKPNAADGPGAHPHAVPAHTTAQFAPGPSSSSAVAGQANAPNGLITPEPASAVLAGARSQAQRIDLRQANSANKDGRVRNPIPSKLKGKTSQKQGMFEVMHMDLKREEKEARYDAAKRNSESTALQAKMAETDHYVSHHRRANYSRPKLAERASSGTPGAVGLDQSMPRPPLPLSPKEAKAEQARLLTLLRTLPFATVVDHVCKGLAFFGGVPDAPPPQDGKFPESYEGNGDGSLFVGWVAEIFPDPNRPPRPPAPVPNPTSASHPSLVNGIHAGASQMSGGRPFSDKAPKIKRPRGRPKGSKSQKPRRDKGIRKGPQGAGQLTAMDGTQAGDEHNGQDQSWVDVEESAAAMDEYNDDDAVERQLLNLLGPSSRDRELGVSDPPPVGDSTGTLSSSVQDIGQSGTPVKKRGRPKGSKNRPKDDMTAQPGDSQMLALPAPQQHQGPTQAPPATSLDPGSAKKKGGRPKGSKNKPKATSNDAAQDPTIQSQTHTGAGSQAPVRTTHIPPPTFPTGTMAPGQGATTFSAINGDAGRTGNANTVIPKVKESTITGAKRKRPSNKPSTSAADGHAAETSSAPNSSARQTHSRALVSESPVPVPHLVGEQTQHAGWAAEANTASNPAVKRQRLNSSQTKRQGTSTAAPTDQALAGSIGEAAAPSQIDLTLQPVQKASAAIGLDAHLERFQAVHPSSDQSQNYGHRQQRQQQQVPNAAKQSGPSASTGGLDAHLESFSNLQSRPQSTPANARPQTKQQNPLPSSTQQQRQQLTSQSTSPTPSQMSKPPMMTGSLSQQGTRAAPNYFAPNQTPSYNTQNASYGNAQRQQHSMSPSVSSTGLVQQSTQFASQSTNSPLLGGEGAFRGSPQLGLSNAGSFGPRRTPSASSIDNAYRPAVTGAHQSSPFANTGRQASSSSSHTNMGHSFPPFSGDATTFLDMQGLGDANSGSSMNIGNSGGYSLGGSHARTNSGNSASLYGTSGAMNSGGMGSGFRNQNNRW